LYDNITIGLEQAQMPTNPNRETNWQRFEARALQGFAEDLLARAGMRAEQAQQVAQTLVEADLMGHTTHGLQLLAAYLRDIEDGRMTVDGEPAVVQDPPGAATGPAGSGRPT
jgi:LDH2 family malate/lactate/ureidoglycolate dehydrogenase